MDKVEAAYKKVMVLAAGKRECVPINYTEVGVGEFDVAVSELMIAVMEMTGEKLAGIYQQRNVHNEVGEAIRICLDLRSSLRQLQCSLEAPQTDLRSS